MKFIKKYFNFPFGIRRNKHNNLFSASPRKAGVSLIETVITIVILSFALTGAIYLMTTVVESTAQNKNRITAIYLAQECAELTRNLRDSAWKQNLPWDCAFPQKTEAYRISPNASNLPPLTKTAPTDCQKELAALVEKDDGTSGFFILNKDNGTFTHENLGNAQATNFERKILIKDADAEKMTIVCEISWKNKFKNEKLEIAETLTNWKKH